ncbi:DUF4232 domain-containing protein [Streptomyces sp. NPDC057702]|uniref:DUF4232 domain-containing protein n=1 Tax=unclassified Streptomyces TaxID=2593676 RepID=UPI003697D4FC
MRAASFTHPLAVAGLLLLTACGTDTHAEGSSPRAADATDPPRATPCATGRGDAPAASRASASPGRVADAADGGVRVVTRHEGATSCAEFEVTNRAAEPLTYTISFTAQSPSGEALDGAEQTVASVPPGRTVRRAVVTRDLPTTPTDPTSVRITKVRSVPTRETPSRQGPCPTSGVRLYADEGSAAMGLRAVSLHVENCGTRVTRLNGYPRLQLLDEGRDPLRGVRVLRGGSAIATGTGADGQPRPLALRPGERAYAVLVWRNTADTVGEPAHAPYVRVWREPGATPVTVTPELDLGTTGRVGIGPWKKSDEHPAGAPTTDHPPARPTS